MEQLCGERWAMKDQTTFVPDRNASSAGEPALYLRLVFHSQASRWGELLPLDSRRVVIGRDQSLFSGGPLVDPKISRKHAELQSTKTGVRLRDLGSSNGTFVNGIRIDRVDLALDDRIRVGDCFFALVTEASETDDSPLVGDSVAIRKARREIRRVAPSEASLLLVGETGCGKELAAQEIHRISRRSGQFVAVNCGAIPESLLESELFGHTKGAFSGADRNKSGLFEVAQGGTLFLDEIGELPIAMQAKLLRVLQDKEVRPLGSTRGRRIDTRVVAATNRNLIAAINTKQFRGDLYSRISQWVIQLPPLRERWLDIPILLQAFLPPGETRTLCPELVGAFVQHSWPFNVRELQSMLAQCRAEAPARGPISVSSGVLEQLETHRGIRIDGDALDSGPQPRERAPERQILERLLIKCHGNVNQVAQELGKHRFQIYRWLNSYQLDPAQYRLDARHD